MKTKELFRRLAELQAYHMPEGFCRWVGSLGYSTLPRTLTRDGWVSLPVAHTVGYADSGQTYNVPAGDVEGAIREIPVGGTIVLPDYSGSNWCGEWRFTRSPHGWDEEYTS